MSSGSFASCSFQRKNNDSCRDNNTCKKKSTSSKNKNSRERESDVKAKSQKSRASDMNSHREKEAEVDKRSLAFENEFAKNKAKEFKDVNTKSKAHANKFESADKAKKIRRNHIDNQRNLKNQEYCLIEEKKYIKKRFLKDDSSEACEDMDKDFAANFERCGEERCSSQENRRCAEQKDQDFCENAKSMKSEKARKDSCKADERNYSECSDKAYESKNECDNSEECEHKYSSSKCKANNCRKSRC